MPFQMKDLSMSTSWNFRKANSGRELIDQLLAFGFSQVELNYQVKAEWLPEIYEIVKRGEVKISSVHNVFPKTYDEAYGTDSVLLGYEDETKRAESVRLGKISIDHAAALGAKAVVFHPTEVPLGPEKYDKSLKKLIASGKRNSEEFETLVAEMRINRLASPYLSQMMKSIEELASYVENNHLPVKLGMENRAMCHQIPWYSEFELIAERFDGSPAGIWIDTGHGIMMQEMGLQALPLKPIVVRNLVGMHIHDAANALDHYAPCTLPGDVLSPFRSYIEQSPIKVLELSGRLTPKEVQTGIENFLQQYAQ